MLVLITYDVRTETAEGTRRLRRVARECVNYGQRVQKSVFECLLDPAQFAVLRDKLEKIINIKEDSIRYYFLGSKWKNRVVHVGVNETFDPEGPLVL